MEGVCINSSQFCLYDRGSGMLRRSNNGSSMKMMRLHVDDGFFFSVGCAFVVHTARE